MAHMHCRDAYLFRVSPTRRTKEERQRWSNTGTTAATSPRIGCRRRKMRAVPQERNSRMATAMTPGIAAEEPGAYFILHRLEPVPDGLSQIDPWTPGHEAFRAHDGG